MHLLDLLSFLHLEPTNYYLTMWLAIVSNRRVPVIKQLNLSRLVAGGVPAEVLVYIFEVCHLTAFYSRYCHPQVIHNLISNSRLAVEHCEDALRCRTLTT